MNRNAEQTERIMTTNASCNKRFVKPVEKSASLMKENAEILHVRKVASPLTKKKSAVLTATLMRVSVNCNNDHAPLEVSSNLNTSENVVCKIFLLCLDELLAVNGILQTMFFHSFLL